MKNQSKERFENECCQLCRLNFAYELLAKIVYAWRPLPEPWKGECE
jgi:hypothetical protein